MKSKIGILRQSAKQLLSLRFFQIVGVFSLIFLALSYALPIWRLFPEIQDRVGIPLHYNIHFGVDLFGPWWLIFTAPVIGSVIFIINYLLAIILWKREKVLSYFLASTVLFSEIILFIAMIFIVLLNLVYG